MNNPWAWSHGSKEEQRLTDEERLERFNNLLEFRRAMRAADRQCEKLVRVNNKRKTRKVGTSNTQVRRG